MKKILILLVFTILLFSCCNESQQERELNIALKHAGANHTELEKVLNYYSKEPTDTLKYKAACFLITNMPGHYSYRDTTYINKYYNEIDSVSVIYKDLGDPIKDSLFKKVKDKYHDKLELTEDIHFITADFLIDNIERSFDVWQNGEWAKHVGFDDFCEYILPYKVTECQTLDNWREYFLSYCNGSLEFLHHCDIYKNLAYKACETVNEDLRRTVRPRLSNESHIPIRRMRTLTQIPFGLCEDYAFLAAAVMKAKGIPVTVDFTPQWPFRSQGHHWNMLLNNPGKNIVFEGAGSAPGTPHKEDHKMAKVFRKTYAINKDIQEIYRFEKYVPETFRTPFLKDVTDEYMTSTDIEIRLDEKSEFKYAYLCVFNNKNWIPVQWGRVSGKKVTFEKMGRDIVYLPVFYNKNGLVPFSDPILVTSIGHVVKLQADSTNKQNLKLARKFPVFPHMYDIGTCIVGGKFEVADNAEFTNSRTLHTIKEFGTEAREIRLDSIKEAYRYWRYYPPDFAWGNIAELSFYEKNDTIPNKGKIIGTEGSCQTDKRYRKEGAFDGDVLTFFDAPHYNGGWVGMDFNRPVNIERIVYTPRSDGNMIEIGDEYELMYWNNNDWKSLGKQIAENVFLDFRDCPKNALFLLHNHTKGNEERIFTYENGKQIWW